MKIVLINSKFNPDLNTGAEKFTEKLFEKLLNSKNEVYLLSLINKNSLRNKRYKKIFVSKNKFIRKFFLDYYNPISKKSIERELKKIDPDLVHINNFYGIGSQTINKISKQYPTLITVHDYFPICYSATLIKELKNCKSPCTCYYPFGKLHKKLMHHHLKNIWMVSPSEFLKKKLQENDFLKVRNVPNGEDLIKEKTDYSKTILFVGRVTYEKGLKTVIESLNGVNNFNIIVLGDGPLKAELAEKYKNINFLGFKNPREYYTKSSILIAPSIWYENFPYSIMEAMSYGLCVLASNIGGIPELVKDMKTGLLFEPSNEEDFKQKLYYLINNPDEIKRMGKSAREFVRKSFNWDRVVKDYEEVYKGVIREFKNES